MNCPICEHDESRVIFATHEQKWNWRKVCCLGCGFVYADPPMTEEHTKKFYEGEYNEGYLKSSNDSRTHDDKLAWEIFQCRRQYNFIVKTIPIADDNKILDIGCADGALLAMLKEHGCEVLGMEPGSQYTMSRLGIDIVNKNIMDADDLGKFDMILASYTLEHIQDLSVFFEKIYSMLTDTGLLYISVPNLAKCPYSPSHTLAPSHFYGFSPVSLNNMVWKYGFVPIALEDTESVGSLYCVARKKTYMDNANVLKEDPESVWLNMQMHYKIYEILCQQDVTKRIIAINEVYDKAVNFRDILDYMLFTTVRSDINKIHYLQECLTTKKVYRSKEPDDYTLADVHHCLAMARYSAGDKDQALQQLLKAERLYPSLYKFYSLREFGLNLKDGIARRASNYTSIYKHMFNIAIELGEYGIANEALAKATHIGLK